MGKRTLIAWKKAGYREKFTMKNGIRTNVYIRGHKCWRYTYPTYEPYQDANGATFDTITKEWIE